MSKLRFHSFEEVDCFTAPKICMKLCSPSFQTLNKRFFEICFHITAFRTMQVFFSPSSFVIAYLVHIGKNGIQVFKLDFEAEVCERERAAGGNVL